ncbi:MAG TPA: HupE/UreJ family protein [Cyclobacteriaceae bacterium]
MSEFSLYFSLGVEHILDWNGYDHLIFIIALCAVYSVKEWKKVLILVTAFTVGHSVTLALSTLNIFSINSELIEFLIPLTILVTAFINVLVGAKQSDAKISTNYFFAFFFGLIHGMGFSNYLKALLGGTKNIAIQLVSFNLGLESGQIVIVMIFMLFTYLFIEIFKIDKKEWRLVVSSIISGMALIMVFESKFW